jgi:thioredoxin-like negative regulator of GroEL
MPTRSTTARTAALAALALLAALFDGLPAQAAKPSSSTPSSQVAWRTAAAPVDIDKAFAQARAARKPVLLYWGATWCPPCNQLKATLFNRQDFAQLSRSFVAVHVDGDLPGAQKLGQQFKVSGYPTLVLLRPDGSELTRLPGEAEPTQVMETLRLGLAGGRPVKAVLADALNGTAAATPLSADEWRLLSFYSWETDDDQLLAGTSAADVLAQLAPGAARRGAAPETSTRLWFKALAASNDSQGLKADDSLRERVRRVLADPPQWRPQADVLVNGAPEMVSALGETEEERQAMSVAFEPVLRALQADAGLSWGDRVTTLTSRIELARIEQPRRELQPALPAALLADAQALAREADHAITDAYERQAEIGRASCRERVFQPV